MITVLSSKFCNLTYVCLKRFQKSPPVFGRHQDSAFYLFLTLGFLTPVIYHYFQIMINSPMGVTYRPFGELSIYGTKFMSFQMNAFQGIPAPNNSFQVTNNESLFSFAISHSFIPRFLFFQSNFDILSTYIKTIETRSIYTENDTTKNRCKKRKIYLFTQPTATQTNLN